MPRKPDQPYVPDGQAARPKPTSKKKEYVVEHRGNETCLYIKKAWMRWGRYAKRKDAENAVAQLSKSSFGKWCDFRIKEDGE